MQNFRTALIRIQTRFVDLDITVELVGWTAIVENQKKWLTLSAELG